MNPTEVVIGHLDLKLVEPPIRPQPSVLRRMFGCRVLTAWQQTAFAGAFALLGMGLVFAWGLNRITPTVVILDPVIERFEKDYSVYRLRFATEGTELAPCHIIIYGEIGKWNVRC